MCVHLFSTCVKAQKYVLYTFKQSQAETSSLNFLNWHQLFVFCIADWFPIVYRSRCMVAVCCVSCYNKPWLMHLSLAGQIQKQIWNAANGKAINRSIASESSLNLEDMMQKHLWFTSCTTALLTFAITSKYVLLSISEFEVSLNIWLRTKKY